MRKIAPFLAASLAATSAIAAETMTYTYDPHGRLTKVQRAGGNNAGVTTQYSLDPSDNRTNAWQNSGAPPAPPTPLPPAFSISDASVGESGDLVFVVTRHRSFAPPVGYNVSFSVAGGSATSGSDFTPPTNIPLNFSADDYTREVRIVTAHDLIAEGNETLSVTLTGVTNGGTIIDATGVGTILDDDSGNQPPVTATDYLTAQMCSEGSFVDVVSNDSDPDGDLPLTLTSIISATHGTAVADHPYVWFYPTVPGTGSVTYRIQDSGGAIANGTVNVQVTGSGPCP